MSSALILEGTAGTNASTPDDPALRVTGQLDLRAAIQPTTWSTQSIMGRLTVAPNFSYHFLILFGGLMIQWTPDGTTGRQMGSTVAVPASPGELIAVRVNLIPNNGSGQREGRFLTKALVPGDYEAQLDSNDGWVQLGATVVQSGAESIHAGSAPLRIGQGADAAPLNLAGGVFAAQVRAGTTDVRTNPNFAAQAAGTTEFVDALGRPYTLAGNAEIKRLWWPIAPTLELTAELDITLTVVRPRVRVDAALGGAISGPGGIGGARGPGAGSSARSLEKG